MERHRLVVIGDSLSQGFMSGAINRPDIAYPAMVADALGARESFVVPEFGGAGGLPLNLERVLNDLSAHFGRRLDWWEVGLAVPRIQYLLDQTEDYWERGKGSKPFNQQAICHNLAVWGFEVRDAYTVTEGVCRRAIPEPTDNWLRQVPEMPMYRTARRVLNPTFGPEREEWSQLRCARELAHEGGIENLVVALGANNALGTVISLTIRYSEEQDLHRMPHERSCNLYLPQHFKTLYGELTDAITRIGAKNVFLATVPHVTIPPITRGMGRRDGRYYEYYTRPWVWDTAFDKAKHAHLTREQAMQIDTFIDEYNDVIKSTADAHGWHLFDMCGLLDKLAFRRNAGRIDYAFPPGLVNELKHHETLSYLVDDKDRVSLDTRFIRGNTDDPKKLSKGGIIALDGIHPTTIGYGLIADLLMDTMTAAGVSFPKPNLPWDAIVNADTLVNQPPKMLANLQDCLAMLDKRGLLSSVMEHFA